jgi:membrane peptidoglycan carboxypeptidase
VAGDDGPVNRIRAWSWKKKLAAAAGAALGLLILLFLAGYALTPLPAAPSVEATSQATVIQYAGGQELGRVGSQNRQLVTLDAVSDPAQKAVLAAEDRGFYTEPGISAKGILRALFTNVRGGGGIQQGGSTITQQYAKNAYLNQNRTYTRKVREMFLALKLSRKLSKDQILENYLNTIYFGRGASGIEVASKTYFNRSAKNLTVAQAAVLAATIRSPAAYDPTRHPQRARERFRYVLDGMVKKGWLSPAERAAVRYPTVLAPGKGGGSTANDRTGWKGYILDQVEEELARNGFPEDELNRGGLTVQTTIRRSAQQAAVQAVTDAVPPVKDPKDQHSPQAALVSVGPGTGEVWAYYGGSVGVGGIDFAAGDDPRQPGSSFKPYVLATALEQGKGLGTRYDGSSPQQICGQDISNDEGDPALGRTDLVKGLALSVNTVYFRLACDVGPTKVRDLAHRAGITASLTQDGGTAAGIGLGIYEVSVLDQAAGYATFAARGVHAETHFVKAVRSGKHVIYGAKSHHEQAFGEDVAADATYAMQQVVQDGTGTRARLDGRPVAGKTGTTQDNKDAWFCGFTPQLATAVWVGRQDHKPLKGELGVSGGVYGGTVPAQLFKQYMDATLDGQKVEDFPPRANVGKNVDTGSSGNNSRDRSSRTGLPSPSTAGSASPAPVRSPQPQRSPVVPPSAPPPSDGPPSEGPPLAPPSAPAAASAAPS